MTEVKTKEQVFETVKQIIEDLGFENEINESSILKDDIGLDSMDIYEITMECENEFQITIPDEDIEGLTTIGDIVSLIENLLQDANQ